MADYISREAVKEKKVYLLERREFVVPVAEIDWLPAADVVARDCYDRILAENDTMREQLAKIGKKPLDRMDDVRPVVRGKWEPAGGSVFPIYACSLCRAISLGGNFCPNCGADCRGGNDGK